MIECSSCRKGLPVTPEWLGKVIACNNCDQRYRVVWYEATDSRTGRKIKEIDLEPLPMNYGTPY